MGSQYHQNSIAFGKAPRREADNQPINQSVRQLVGQAGRQANRQAKTHSLAFFFQSRTTSTNSGEPQLQRITWRLSGRTLAFRLKCRRFESRLAIAGAGPPTHYSFSPDRGSNPSPHKPLTPPPNPHSPPLKCDIRFQGNRGLKIKISIRGSPCQAE